MIIRSAKFIISNTEVKKCPKPDKPEFAFIGRSNVGKSSLINMLAGNKSLAKTSSKPGKTQLINHFIINDEWYLVDLPGYGYAGVSKEKRRDFEGFISEYLTKRENLICVFVLIDSRLPLQQIDREFMVWLGEHEIPFAIVFTKIDKLTKNELNKNLQQFERAFKTDWEYLPDTFLSSAANNLGKEEILGFIEENSGHFKKR